MNTDAFVVDLTYVEESDPEVQRKVRARFLADTSALAGLGFEEFAFCREQLGSFSAFRRAPTLLLMRIKREVLRIQSRWEATATFVLLRHHNPVTIAVPIGLGTKLYTAFTDGTILISANFPSYAQADGEAVMKYSSRLGIGETWLLHQARVEHLRRAGKQIEGPLPFDRLAAMFEREDRGSTCAPPPRESAPVPPDRRAPARGRPAVVQ